MSVYDPPFPLKRDSVLVVYFCVNVVKKEYFSTNQEFLVFLWSPHKRYLSLLSWRYLKKTLVETLSLLGMWEMAAEPEGARDAKRDSYVTKS